MEDSGLMWLFYNSIEGNFNVVGLFRSGQANALYFHFFNSKNSCYWGLFISF